MTRTEAVQSRGRCAAAVAIAALLAAVGSVRGDLGYVDVAGPRGLSAADFGGGYGTGAAVVDYDDDGDLDIFMPTAAGVPDRLYRNDGRGHFDDIAARVGLDDVQGHRAALWIDFTGDGRLDLIVAGDCFSGGGPCLEVTTIRFFRQLDTGAFDDVTAVHAPEEDGVAVGGEHRCGLAAGDLNGDGWLDVVTGTWGGAATVLMSDGAGGFDDATAQSGIGRATVDRWQPVIHDFDRDGHPDIYWAVDFTANEFWHNQGDGTFVNIAERLGLDNAMNDMGNTLGDYDDDGDLDVYVTEITEAANHNVLFRNDTVDGVLEFREIAVDSGVHDSGFGWGTTFLDADHDGRLDLVATNGWFNGIGYEDRTRFFRNLGGAPVVFEEIGADVGVDDTDWGVSVVAFDMDRDGDLDLLQTCNLGAPPRLLENRLNDTPGAGHWLTVRPRMPAPNPRAVGAVVRVEAGGVTRMRYVSAGMGHLSQEPGESHFGLGAASMADRIVIAWPDGAQSIVEHVAADRVVTIERSACPGTGDLDGDGVIDVRDLVRLLSQWGPCTIACPHDVDGSGAVGGEDVAALFAQWGPCTPG